MCVPPKNERQPATSDRKKIDDQGSVLENNELNPVTENLKLYGGYCLLILFGPFVAWQIFWCTLWEFVDKKTLNFVWLCSKFSDVVSPYLAYFARNKKDGFIILFILYLGVLIPGIFFHELYYAVKYGFDYKRAMAYNLLRIGPMYCNFMWSYALCHKEAHAMKSSLLRTGLTTRLLGNVFNFWCGMFHGVLPGTFTLSHVYIHHKHDNDIDDVHTSALRPRDEFSSWVKYTADWIFYALNISTFTYFVRMKDWSRALKTVFSTLYYVVFVALIAHIHPRFCFWYLFYPLVEGNILLSVVNFTWHAFIDPDDPSNDYVNSTTIVNGLNFCMKEEYHVVHHQYAGVHWSKHRELFEKLLPEYKKSKGTLFHSENIFVVFGCCVAKDYDKLAELYWEPPDDMTKKELAALLKRRLQCAGPDIARRVGRSAKQKAECEQYLPTDSSEGTPKPKNQ